MEVHIGEVSSTVRTTDSSVPISSQDLEQIVRVVLARLREEQDHERRVAEERLLRPAVSAEETSSWE